MSDTTHEDAYLRKKHFETVEKLVEYAQQPLLDDSHTYLKMVQRGHIESTPLRNTSIRTDITDRLTSTYDVGNTKIASKLGLYSDIKTSSSSYRNIDKDLGYKAASLINYGH